MIKTYLVVLCSVLCILPQTELSAAVWPFAQCAMTIPMNGQEFGSNPSVEPETAEVPFNGQVRYGFNGASSFQSVQLNWGTWLYLIPDEVLDSDGGQGQVQATLMGNYEVWSYLSAGPLDMPLGEYQCATNASVTADGNGPVGTPNQATFKVIHGD